MSQDFLAALNARDNALKTNSIFHIAILLLPVLIPLIMALYITSQFIPMLRSLAQASHGIAFRRLVLGVFGSAKMLSKKLDFFFSSSSASR